MGVFIFRPTKKKNTPIQLVKPCQFSTAVFCLTLYRPVCQTIPGIFPALWGQCISQNAAHLPCFYIPRPFQGLGAVASNHWYITLNSKLILTSMQTKQFGLRYCSYRSRWSSLIWLLCLPQRFPKYSSIRESPPQFENRIMAWVYVRSITRSTMCQKPPFVSRKWRMKIS